MSVVNIPIIDFEKESEFKKIFNDELLNIKYKFEGFDLIIYPEDFEHICYEYADGGKYKAKFSIRRARKMLVIRELCNKNVSYILIHQIERENRSVCVLVESIEFALFLIPKTSKKGNYFTIGTIIAYGKQVETKIEKQKNTGKIIKRIKEVFEEGC